MLHNGQRTAKSEADFCSIEAAPLGRTYTHQTRLGHSVFNARYLAVKRYLFHHIERFNARLSTKMPVHQVESSEIIDPTSPLTEYYTEKFPTRVYRTQDGGVLRPATCTTALKLLSSYPEGTVIHEKGICYRVENSGEYRKLKRCSRFCMPDYHGHFAREEVAKAFSHILDTIKQFYQDIGLKKQLIQIFRFTSAEGPSPYFTRENLPSMSSTPWTEDHDITPRPYFKIKYEVNYCGGVSPVQLGTIQVDEDLPRVFGLQGVVLHFTMGSVERLVSTMDAQDVSPALSLKILQLAGEGVSQTAEKLAHALPTWVHERVRVRGTGELVDQIKIKHHQGVCDTPYVVIVGPREVKAGLYTLVNRKTAAECKVDLSQLYRILGETPHVTPLL